MPESENIPANKKSEKFYKNKRNIIDIILSIVVIILLISIISTAITSSDLKRELTSCNKQLNMCISKSVDNNVYKQQLIATQQLAQPTNSTQQPIATQQLATQQLATQQLAQPTNSTDGSVPSFVTVDTYIYNDSNTTLKQISDQMAAIDQQRNGLKATLQANASQAGTSDYQTLLNAKNLLDQQKMMLIQTYYRIIG
jgi:hypothetical protein